MRRMTMIGIGLVLSGILLCVALSGGSFARMLSKDPTSSNEGVITSSGAVLEMSEGTHQVWYKGDVIGPIIVRGPGNVTYTLDEPSDSANYDDVYLWGDFEVKISGEHRFEFMGSGNLYITEDFSVGSYLTLIYIGFGAGSLMVITGIVLTAIGLIRQKKMDQSSFFQEGPATAGPVPQQGAIDPEAGKP